MFEAAGYRVVRLVEAFGPRKVEDVEWIAWVCERGMGAATKDQRIRRRPLELEAMLKGGLRVVCLSRGDLNSRQQADAFRARMRDIDNAWLEAGPWMRTVTPSALLRVL